MGYRVGRACPKSPAMYPSRSRQASILLRSSRRPVAHNNYCPRRKACHSNSIRACVLLLRRQMSICPCRSAQGCGARSRNRPPVGHKHCHPRPRGSRRDFRAIVCIMPAETAVHLSVPISTGVQRSMIELSPNWPSVFAPQVQRVPSRFHPYGVHVLC